MNDTVLAAKLALEAELAPLLRRTIAAYARMWRAKQGQFQPFERYVWLGRFDALLTRHYARTVQVFRGLPPKQGARLDAAALDAAQAERLTNLARRNAERIVTSIEKELMGFRGGASRAQRQALPEFKSDPALENKAERPRITAGYVTGFRSKPKPLSDRAAAIANVNTQTVAEDTRFTIVENGKGSGVVVKVWQSLLDGRERAAHGQAHDQEQGVAGMFTVWGEHLRFPGDTKHGASLKNIINCRCAAEYWLKRPDGSKTRIDQTVSVPARRQRRAGDKPGVTRPATPTTEITLNGRTRATVALADGSLAQIVQQGDKLTVRANRKTVANATIVRRGEDRVSIDGLQVSGSHSERGIATLLHNSVQGSLKREGRTLVPPTLMDDALFAFWKRRDPAAVANDVRNAADAITKWARNQHGGKAAIRFDADGQRARVLLSGGRTLFMTRADLEALGLFKAP